MSEKLMRIAGIATVLVVTLFILLSAESCRQKNRAESWHETAVNMGARAELLSGEITNLLADKQHLREQADLLRNRVGELERRRVPAPPKPAPVPENYSAVAQQLQNEGLQEGLVVAEVPKPSFMGLPDARLALSWAFEAKRIPGFEAKSVADDALILGQKKLIGTMGEEAVAADAAIGRFKLTVDAHKQEGLALRKENEALVKMQVAETTRFKVTLGVAIPAAAYLGWKLGRR